MACPACKAPGSEMEVTEVFVAQPIGSYSLAGVMFKTTGRFRHRLGCRRCPFYAIGTLDMANDQFIVDLGGMQWPAEGYGPAPHQPTEACGDCEGCRSGRQAGEPA